MFIYIYLCVHRIQSGGDLNQYCAACLCNGMKCTIRKHNDNILHNRNGVGREKS